MKILSRFCNAKTMFLFGAFVVSLAANDYNPDEDDVRQRLEKLEKRIAWIVRQIKKILRFLGLNGDKGDE